MNKRYSKRRVILLMSAVLMSFSPLAPKNAEAYLMVTGDTFNRNNYFGPNYHDLGTTLACIILLPFCLLDEKIDGVPAITSQDLIDQGFQEEVARSFVEQGMALTKNLASRKLKLVVEKDDDQRSLEKQIRDVLPSATAPFVNFYTREVLAKSDH